MDLHIHSKDCSDGKMTLEEIFVQARQRQIGVISITDHDSIDCQEHAKVLADQNGIRYITGVELNISFAHSEYRDGLQISHLRKISKHYSL